MKFVLILSTFVAFAAAELDCDAYVECSEKICNTCTSCPSLYLTPYLDTFKGLCALTEMKVAKHCYESNKFTVCWKSLMDGMVEKGLGEIAESCYEDVPAGLCHDEEGNMRSAYDMCELPALNCAVTKFTECVNMQVVSECGYSKMKNLIPHYTCPDIDAISEELQAARDMCKPACPNNPANNEGWFNNLTENPPCYFETPYLCVFDQLGMMSLTRTHFTVDQDAVKAFFGEELYDLAMNPEMEGPYGCGEFERRERFNVNRYIKSFVDKVGKSCGKAELGEMIAPYQCPDPATFGVEVMKALETCTPACEENPAPEGWYNSKTQTTPKYHETTYLCVFDQLGFVSLTRTHFTIELDAVKQTFGDDLYYLARIEELEGPEGCGTFERRYRWHVDNYIKLFTENVHGLCGCGEAEDDNLNEDLE